MKSKCLILLSLLISFCFYAEAQSSFTSRGVGGGGALFSPSINPANNNEFYVACDMSELFHTTNNGTNYESLHFTEIQGGHHAKVCFTANSSVRYCLSYVNDLAVPVKTTDQGQTWNNLPGNPDPWEETFFIGVDYDNSNRVVIAYYGAIYFSSDGGNQFTLIHTAASINSGVLVGGVFFEGNNIYIGTNDGLFISTDGGISFGPGAMTGIPAGEAMYSFTGSRQGAVTRLFCLTGDAGDVYADLPGSDYWGLNRGVYSVDIGSSSWVSRMNGITPGTDFPMFISMAQNNISSIYIAGSNIWSQPAVIKSTNGGSQWDNIFNTLNNENIATGWCGDGGDRQWSYAECPFGFTVAPNDANRLIFTDYGFVHQSYDGGVTWKQAYVSGTDENNQGSSTPTGKDYHSIGLENTTCWQVAWMSPDTMFSCFSDIKGCRSTNGGTSWDFNYTGHNQNSMYRLARHPNGNLYAATSTIHDIYQSTRLQDNVLDATGAGGKVIYSTTNGSSWQTMHDFTNPVFWVAIDPNNTNRMYASVINHAQGEGGIYRTDNLSAGAASIWTKLPDPPRTEGHPACIEVLQDGNMVCTFSGRRDASGVFTSSSGVFIYDPSLNSWTDVSDNGMHYWTKDIVIDPNDPNQNTWYACVFNGWGGAPNGLGGLYRTADRGQSWNVIYDGSSVSSITFRPGYPQEAYITTEQNGLLRSVNISSPNPGFTLVNDYPFRQPERVFFNPYNTNEMWVTSFGYGMDVKSLLSTQVGNLNYSSIPIAYPNPSNGTIRIKTEERSTAVKYQVLDIKGHMIYELNKPVQNEIELKNLNNGTYVLKIYDQVGYRTEKLIIEH